MASADMIRESQDPSTTGARLAELAQADRDLWPAIAVHPAAYPALLDWLGEQGDPTVKAVLALRSGSPAAAPAPAGPPPPPAETPTAHAAAAPGPSPVGSAGDNNSKNLWLVCGMVVVILALIGGAAFGATKVFGGDDDKDEASASQTIDAPKPSDAAEPSDAPTVDAPEPSGPPTVDSNIPFCEGFKGAQRVLGGNADATPGSGTVRTLASIIGNIERVAPAEVKNDVGVMADYFEALSDPSTLDTSTMPERTKTFQESATRLSAYYDANCT